jgi:hypothetical protein
VLSIEQEYLKCYVDVTLLSETYFKLHEFLCTKLSLIGLTDFRKEEAELLLQLEKAYPITV